jgi:hypothetical protein
MSDPLCTYTQSLSFLESEKRGSIAAELVIRWRPWSVNRPHGDEDEDDEDYSERIYKPGIERAIIARIAVGPLCEERRRVSFSTYMAPTIFDHVDMTEVGMALDENNEFDIGLGEKVPVNIAMVRARCCGNFTCKSRVPVPLLVMVEMIPYTTYKRIKYTFVPGEDVYRMTINEVSTLNFSSVDTMNRVLPGYLPQAPKPRNKRAMTVAESCAEAAKRRAAKLGIDEAKQAEQAADGANASDASDASDAPNVSNEGTGA